VGAASIIWRAAVNKGNMFNRVKASSTRAFVTWLGLAIVLVAIDQLTKQLIVRSMSPFDFKEVLPFLALVFTLNPRGCI
jgi:lipoprotein signal peptidase